MAVHYYTGSKDDYDAIVDQWLNQLTRDTDLSKALKSDTIQSIALELFKSLLVGADKLPQFDADQIVAIFDQWQTLFKQLTKYDLSSRNAAFFVFSLKSSVTDHIKLDDDPNQQLVQINQFLDFLARLMFELYTAQYTEPKPPVTQMPSLHTVADNILSQSPAMIAVYKAISLVLTNDVTVLLQGESGTGKDVIAQLIHNNSSRKKKPFIAINCGAIPKDLIESELFGYEKGAFTGADSRYIGKIEQAHTGTLFLDEIGDLDISLQVKLLRIIQNRTIDRIGGGKSIPIDIRIIAATHTDLEQAVETKKFRLDLYYRLNVYPIMIPPLRERTRDILPLAQFFVKKYCAQFNQPAKTISRDAQAYLEGHPFPGNIRELENLIQRAVIMSHDVITRFTLQIKPGNWYKPSENKPTLSLVEPDNGSIRSLDTIEADAIRNALQIKKGNVKQVAEALGISRTTLYNKAKRYDISL